MTLVGLYTFMPLLQGATMREIHGRSFTGKCGRKLSNEGVE